MQRENILYQKSKRHRFFRKDIQHIQQTSAPLAIASVASLFICGNTPEEQVRELEALLAGFGNQTILYHHEFYAGLQRNPRRVDRYAAETLAAKFAAGTSLGVHGSMADPSQHFRTTVCIDDDGGECPAEFYTRHDDEDDEDQNPCNDDDDGGDVGDNEAGTGSFGKKCCTPLNRAPTQLNGVTVCRAGTLRAYDDDESDSDDEESSSSKFPGNECDDDDAKNPTGESDDDDAKYTYTEINNLSTSTLASHQLISMLAGVEAKVNATHGQLSGLINFANEIWTCAMGVCMPVELIIAADFNVTIYTPGPNSTWIANVMMVEVPVQVTICVDLCSANGTYTQTATGMSNYTTEVLVMGTPQNVTIPFNITSTFFVSIPDSSHLPMLEQLGGVVPEVVVINSTHFTFNATDHHYATLPLLLNVSFPLIDPQPYGPFALVGKDGEPCVYCSRLCEEKPFRAGIQVVRKRLDREIVHLLLHMPREVRILYSHLTPKGDLLCELKDIVDWLNCFVRSMMFPQMERFISCLELFYWGAQSAAPFPDYVKLVKLLEYIGIHIERIEFWYAEMGYYTQDTIDRGCINPAILEITQACFDHFNITAPGKAGVCTSENLTNSFPFSMGDCGIDGFINTRYGHAKTCRAYAVQRVVRALDEAVDIVERMTTSMLVRVDLIAEYLRVAREDHPVDYVFPGPDSKCFAMPNTTLAEFVPSGDETLAMQYLYNTTDLATFNISATQPIVNV